MKQVDLAMSPTVIHEPLVRRFSFYKNGHLCEGMIYNNQIYKLVETFNRQNESQAYSLLRQIRQSGNLALVTASTNVYRVWMDFQTQFHPSAHALSCR